MKYEQLEFSFATRFSPPPSVAAVVGSRSMTRQEFKRECDINYILARVGAGQIELVPPEATYQDFSEVPSNYDDLASKLLDADQRFASLPSKLRDRFGNSPANLLAFLGNEANRDEAIKLGLVVSKSDDLVVPAENVVPSANG